MESDFKVVGPQGVFPLVKLMEPSNSRYVMLAAKVDRRPAFFPDSAKKRELVASIKETFISIRRRIPLLDTSVFTSIFVPPGTAYAFMKHKAEKVRVADFDLVILIECAGIAEFEHLTNDREYIDLVEKVGRASSATQIITASNVRRIAPVDHSRQGVFLFNYFYAEERSKNIEAWHYTAGWFQHETGLDNSTVLLPDADSQTPYTLINHCRWDHLRDVIPSLAFKRSFKDFILANFSANQVAPMPILYRLA